MTTLKRIVAVLLAVMLIASIGLVAASAADSYTSLTISVNKDGFKYTVYQIATLNQEGGKIKDGSYTCVSNDIKNIVESDAANTGASFRNALDALYTSNKGAFGEPIKKSGAVDKVQKGNPVTVNTPGIYYAVLAEKSDKPATYTEANNVVIVWPEFNGTNWVGDTTLSLDKKVKDGTDSFDKNFTKYDTTGKLVVDKDPKFKGLNETVSFTLEGGIVGSELVKLDSFIFTDTMSEGLTYTTGSMKIYYGLNGVLDKTTDLLADGSFTMGTATDDDKNTVFTISATKTLLNSDDFYKTNVHNAIYVQYDATVNNKAVYTNVGNPNKAHLYYKNAAGTEKTFDDQIVYVYTFWVSALKKKADKDEPLSGAKFQIGKGKDDNGNLTDVFAYGKSDANGQVIFREQDNDTSAVYRFAPGTYYCKETYVPNGYALSTKIYDVVVPEKLEKPNTQDNSKFNIKVQGEGADGAILNYPVKLPETGGAGTMMFTIIGGCLVLAAGVMFVIIMKKRASSK